MFPCITLEHKVCLRMLISWVESKFDSQYNSDNKMKSTVQNMVPWGILTTFLVHPTFHDALNQRFPLSAWSASIASNNDLKFPTPNPWNTNISIHRAVVMVTQKYFGSPQGQVVKVANLQRFYAFNRLSSHHCEFQPSWGHVRQAKFCLRVVRWVFFWDLPFWPHLTIDLAQNEQKNLDRP